MTGTYWVPCDSASFSQMWKVAMNDSGSTLGVMPPAQRAGDGFTDLLANLLLASGFAQPTPVVQPRATGRADMGRLQVAAARAGRDLVVVHAESLTASDARLLQLAAHRACVGLWLVAEDDGAGRHREAPIAVPSIDVNDALDTWSRRGSRDDRAVTWPCHSALTIGGTAPGCRNHDDASSCVLEWFPHALMTARVTPSQVRARLHELTRIEPQRRWDILARSRDHYFAAMAAAREMRLPSATIRAAHVHSLSLMGDMLFARGREYPVPVAVRPALVAQRDVLVADGQRGRHPLFRPSAPSAHAYALPRPGDPEMENRHA